MNWARNLGVENLIGGVLFCGTEVNYNVSQACRWVVLKNSIHLGMTDD